VAFGPHGYLPERQVQTGIGAVTVRVPWGRDQDVAGYGASICFTSSTLSPYLLRDKGLEELLPWLYLHNHIRAMLL
jgi:hypothetical protein